MGRRIINMATVTASDAPIYGQWLRVTLPAIATATKSVTVTTMSIHPPPRHTAAPLSQAWEQLHMAARAGVQVTIVCPAPTTTIPATLRNATAAHHAQRKGITTRFATTDTLLHAKTVLVDTSLLVVQTANWTAQAASNPLERALSTMDRRSIDEHIAWLRAIPAKTTRCDQTP